MADKNLYHGRQYQRRLRRSPHGKLIQGLYLLLKRWETRPEDVIIQNIKPGGSILDLGCGDGDFCFKVERLFHRVVGIDVSNSRIKRARRIVGKNKKFLFLQGDMDEKLPFGSSSFDIVSSIASFQYCYDPYFTLKEIKRVLKPKGHLFIQVTNLAWIVYRIQLLLGRQIFTSHAYHKIWDGGVLRYFTFESLESLLKEEAFLVNEKTCSGLLRKIKILWPTLLASDIIIKAAKRG